MATERALKASQMIAEHLCLDPKNGALLIQHAPLAEIIDSVFKAEQPPAPAQPQDWTHTAAKEIWTGVTERSPREWIRGIIAKHAPQPSAHHQGAQAASSSAVGSVATQRTRAGLDLGGI